MTENSFTASSTRSIIRISKTSEITGFHNVTLRRMELEGTFPKRIKLNPNGGTFGAAGHFLDEVLEWVESRRASRDAEAAVIERAGKAHAAKRKTKVAA